MPSFNQLILIGHTTREVETRYTPGNTQIADCGIAVNHKYTVNGEKREEVMFMDFVAFGKVAEIIAKYVGKGDAVMLTGRVVLDQWEDKQTGQKRSKHKLNVEQVRLLGGRQDGGSREPQQGRRGDTRQQQTVPPDNDIDMDSEPIPF